MTEREIIGKSPRNNSPQNIVRRFFAFPRWQDAALAVSSAILLILAFPDFELWFLAWFALVPLLIAVERNKSSASKSFWLGLLTGTAFFYGSCWWLAYAPIHYGGLPAPVIYILLLPATLGAGFFVGIFAAISARLSNKFGLWSVFAVPFVWTACEFLRLQITGNAWNALGYSQAFVPSGIRAAEYGGVFLVSFVLVVRNALIHFAVRKRREMLKWQFALPVLAITFALALIPQIINSSNNVSAVKTPSAVVIALQPNVPMSGLTYQDYYKLREQHVQMAETALREAAGKPELKDLPKIVVFPESPMNFVYAQDSEFREFLRDFDSRNQISLIFNAGEPTISGDGYHNSAVMVNQRGEKVAQYDKMRLVPFGEFVPEWLPGNEYLPTVVGRTKPGKDFRLMAFGSSVRAGVLICYESAFGDLSGGMAANGADVLIELTNDGYSGDTAILRQHLANAVFRAVETNRPVLRVTNVGITANISERGEISGATKSYTTDTRIWTAAKSDGRETFYVRNGDLFAWVCTILSLIFLTLTFFIRRKI